MKKNINNYPKKPHFIIDVTRPANGCGGCTKYAMKSSTAQQGSWKTKDGSAWWLRDAKYNEPNGDYHANCYLHIYDVNPNNVRFNDGNCNYYSTEYLCQKVQKKGAKPKYSYAGTGKNSCASVKKKPITTEAGCKAAAKALKKTYAGKGSYSTWQKACFMTSNKFYFNVHKAGKTHKSGNPVCAGPAKTAPKYSMAGNGKSNCGKQKVVSSEAACKAAGKTLKKAWGGSGSYATWPKACFLYNNKLYFNRHAKGKANKQGNPVCAGAGSGKKTTKKQQTLKCRSGSASNCKTSTIKTPKYSAGNLVRIHNGRRVRKSTETDSCPDGFKIWSPRNKNDWIKVYNAMGKNINNYPKRPHFIVDVTRPANGCGGCTKYAMKSTTAQQGSWRTTDRSAWWLRDARYNEPNGDYHANCYLHIYDVNPNNVRFNDGSCSYHSNSYLCQPRR